MRHYEGYVRMNRLEFEVPNDATDIEVEEAFNDAVQECFDRGFDSDVDYDYKLMSSDDEEE